VEPLLAPKGGRAMTLNQKGRLFEVKQEHDSLKTAIKTVE